MSGRSFALLSSNVTDESSKSTSSRATWRLLHTSPTVGFALLVMMAALTRFEPHAAGEPDAPKSSDNSKSLSPEEKSRLDKERFAQWTEAGKLRSAGKLGEAVVAAEKALALTRKTRYESHPDVFGLLKLLADIHQMREAWPEARRAHQEVFAWTTKQRGKDHWETTDARVALETVEQLTALTDEQRKELREARATVWKISQTGANQPPTAAAATVVQSLTTVTRLVGAKHRYTADCARTAGWFYATAKDYRTAEKYYLQALEIRKQLFGDKHPEVADSLSLLASVAYAEGDNNRSVLLHKEALAIRRQSIGDQHFVTGQSFFNLALVERRLKEFPKAVSNYREALANFKKSAGPVSEQVAVTLLQLAGTLEENADWAAAKLTWKELIDLRTKVDGAQHWRTADTRRSLELIDLHSKLTAADRVELAQASAWIGQAHTARDAKRPEEGLPLIAKALKVRVRLLGENNLDTVRTVEDLAILCVATHDYHSAEKYFRQVLETREQSLGELHPDTAVALANLGALFDQQKDYAKAEPFFQRSLSIRKITLGEKHPEYAKNLRLLALVCQARGAFDRAEPLLRQLADLQKAQFGETHLEYASSLFLLAEFFDARKEWRQAASFYLQGVAIHRLNGDDASPKTLLALSHAAARSEWAEDWVTARQARQELIAARLARDGKDHWRVIEAKLELAHVELLSKLTPAQRGELRQAESWMKLAEGSLEAIGPIDSGEAVDKNRRKQFELAQRALEVRLRLLGDHRETARSAVYTAILDEPKESKRIEKHFRLALDIRRRILGENHPDFGTSLYQLANHFASHRDVRQAVPLYLQVQKFYREDPNEPARTFYVPIDLIELYEKTNDWTAAALARNEYLKYQTQLHGKDHWQTVDARVDLAHAEAMSRLTVSQRQELVQAAKKFDELVEDREGKRSERFAGLLKVFEVQKRLLGANDSLTIRTLQSVFALADDATAEGYARQIVEARRQTVGDKHPTFAESLKDLADLYKQRGAFKNAEALYRQIAVIAKHLGDKHPLVISSRDDLQELYEAQGDYARAAALLRQKVDKLAIDLRGPNKDLFELSEQSLPEQLADLYRAQGDYEQAEIYYLRAIAISRKVEGKNKRLLGGIAMLRLAAMYMNDLGDLGKAEPLYIEMVKLMKEDAGVKDPAYAECLQNLADLYQNQKKFDQAETLHREALEIVKSAIGERSAGYSNSLLLLGTCYLQKGDYAKAEPLLLQALKNLRDKLHPTEMVRPLNHLANLHQLRGEFAKAEPYLREVMEIQSSGPAGNLPENVDSLNNLAMLYWRQGNHAKAEPLFRQSLELTRAHLDRNAACQSDRQQLAATATLRKRLDDYLSFTLHAKHSADKAYNFLLPWKGAVLQQQRLQQQIGRLALDQKDSPEARLYTDLEITTRKLANLALARPETPDKVAEQRRQLTELMEQRERIESELSRQYTDFRQEKQRARLTAADLQKVLPSDVALIDYLSFRYIEPSQEKTGWFREGQRLLAFVTRAGKPLEMLDLGPLAPVTEAVAAWRASVKRFDREPAKDDPAVKLRQLIWEPVANQLEGMATVLISPDGPLAQLPFGALPGKQPNTYLIEERSIVVIPTPQLLPELLAPREMAKLPLALLLIGDVNFDASPGGTPSVGEQLASRTGERSGDQNRWARLPGTVGEIEAMRTLHQMSFPKATITDLRNEQPTEAAVRQHAPRHPYLHLATHGFFAPASLRSALVPSAKSKESREHQVSTLTDQRGAAGIHPGLLSGLVLAGANHRPENDRDDGILTSLEVASLDLRGVELAVLSACETGLGAVAGGEGLLGLQRAFQIAGARTTVASLWSVPDEATRVLMERFYRNLWIGKDGKKLSRIDALREAQLWLLKEGKAHPGIARGLERDDLPRPTKDGRLPPYYWAAFSLFGDWR